MLAPLRARPHGFLGIVAIGFQAGGGQGGTCARTWRHITLLVYIHSNTTCQANSVAGGRTANSPSAWGWWGARTERRVSLSTGSAAFPWFCAPVCGVERRIILRHVAIAPLRTPRNGVVERARLPWEPEGSGQPGARSEHWFTYCCPQMNARVFDTTTVQKSGKAVGGADIQTNVCATPRQARFPAGHS